MSEEPIELTPDLLDDFYAECEEQLSNIRAQLVALEAPAATAEAPAAAIESVYRSIHSFKGNAAIVGLASAERLTHVAEGLMRRLTRGEATLDPGKLDLLARTAHRLEQIVAAFRAEQTLPGIDDLLAGLETAAGNLGHSSGRGTRSTPPAIDPLSATGPAPEKPAANKLPGWRASFRPTPELDRRGINVNNVRTRLGELGSIIAAKPTVETGGGIRFDFTVAASRAPADLGAWAADGVTWERETDTTGPAPRPLETEPVASAPDTLYSAASHIVRVDLSRLDELMRITGEMVIHRSRLQDRIAHFKGDTSSLQEVNLGLMRSLRDLRAAIMRVRMVSVVEIFSRLPFVVRDLTRGTDKSVRLSLEGQETEIDKYLVERLKEPLLHLVRNAVSHGIETTAERTAAGKSPEAQLILRAATAGDAVEIQIRDDGRGVNAELIAERARRSGLPVPEELDQPALLRLLCTPGFSTREEADRAAGRGVGMAVVESTLRDLGGTLSLATEPGKFTEFTLRLPLTLSIAETFIVAAGSQLCAVPQGFVEEVIQIRLEDVHTVSGSEVVPNRGGLLPLIRLRQLFGTESSSKHDLPVLVLRTERGAVGLAVDRVIGQREVVVRPMNDPLLRVPGVSGATELGDGRPVLILDASTLTRAPTLSRAAAPRLSAALRQTAS